MHPIEPLPVPRWKDEVFLTHIDAAKKINELIAAVNDLTERLEDMREANNLFSGR